RYVAIKVTVADPPAHLETEVLRTLTASKSKHPHMAYLPTLLDEFELVEPNGTQHCIVTDVHGVNVWDRFEEERAPISTSTVRRPQHKVQQAVDCLHQHDIVHGNLNSYKVVWTARGIDDLTEKEFSQLLRYEWTYEVKSKDGSSLSLNVSSYLVMNDCLPAEVLDEDNIMLVGFGQAFYQTSLPDRLDSFPCWRAPEIVFGEQLKGKVDV
ncbi:hypothetical protein K470DRAFT_213158, partial [Piedraia hortae CBS 480.64]